MVEFLTYLTMGYSERNIITKPENKDYHKWAEYGRLLQEATDRVGVRLTTIISVSQEVGDNQCMQLGH